jgi:hypothetical protein
MEKADCSEMLVLIFFYAHQSVHCESILKNVPTGNKILYKKFDLVGTFLKIKKKKLVLKFQITRRHKPEDRNSDNRLRQNLKFHKENYVFNPLNVELNPICHLLALLGAHHILHVSRIRVKSTYYLIFYPINSISSMCK